MISEEKRVHENLKQLTFTKTGDKHHPLHVRIQTPDKVDIGLWLDRWQTVDVVSWLQSLVSIDSNKKEEIINLLVNALLNDAAHHKQRYLWRIAEALGLDLSNEWDEDYPKPDNGIAP